LLRRSVYNIHENFGKLTKSLCLCAYLVRNFKVKITRKCKYPCNFKINGKINWKVSYINWKVSIKFKFSLATTIIGKIVSSITTNNLWSATFLDLQVSGCQTPFHLTKTPVQHMHNTPQQVFD
jgi:hypothetical protein